MEFELTHARLRPPRLDDAPAFATHLDDVDVWRNLRDHVPQPYSVEDARAFLVTVVDVAPQRVWAIEVDGAAVGAIGLHPKADVHRRSVEIGFWIGRRFWGRGIASEAVPAIVAHAFASQPGLLRVQGDVFAWNPASARVLTKSGFRLEGRLRDAVTKDGRTTDLLVFGKLRADG